MTGKETYDGTLQMFVEQPRSVDVGRLRFLRWLAEHGRLEHPVAGPALAAIVSGGRDRDDDPPLAA
jgi:hypothetical protein